MGISVNTILELPTRDGTEWCVHITWYMSSIYKLKIVIYVYTVFYWESIIVMHVCMCVCMYACISRKHTQQSTICKYKHILVCVIEVYSPLASSSQCGR